MKPLIAFCLLLSTLSALAQKGATNADLDNLNAAAAKSNLEAIGVLTDESGPDNAAVNEAIAADTPTTAALLDDYFTQNAGNVWLKNTAAKLGNRGGGGLCPPIHEMIIGDSIATGFETTSRLLGEPIVGYKISPWYQVISGTVTANNTGGMLDSTKWINGVHYVCAVGSTSDWFYLGTTVLRADRIGVAYLQGTGSFDLQYQLDGGSWTTAATIDTSAATGGAYAEYAITNPYQLGVKVRITNVTTASVTIIGVGYWLNNVGGVVQSICNLSGNFPANVLNTPANIVSGIIGGCDPDIVIAAWNDPASNWSTGGNWDTIVSRFEAGHAAIDWLLVSGNPFNPASGDGDLEAMVIAQREAQRAWARENGESFIDGYSMFRSWADALANGFIEAGANDYHLSSVGTQFRNRVISGIIAASLQRRGGAGLQLSESVWFKHPAGIANSKIELGPADTSESGTHAGLFLRGGNTGNSLRLGSRSSAKGNEAADLYWTGTATGENLGFGVGFPQYAVDYLKWQSSGNTTSGRVTQTCAWPMAIQLKRSTGADPSAPSTGNVVIFLRLNGSSKLELCALFPTGAVQVFATQP
jgi:hypothetical protein